MAGTAVAEAPVASSSPEFSFGIQIDGESRRFTDGRKDLCVDFAETVTCPEEP